MKFAHLADTHLGYRQYGLFEREKDFYEVFDKVIDKIIEENVDFVIHSGDLFETARPSPMALLTFQKGLLKLKGAGIPMYAIAGNHDVVMRKGSIPPHVIFKKLGLKVISTINPTYMHGDIFIAGLPYYPASHGKVLKSKLAELSQKANRHEKSILVLHQGIDQYFSMNYELELGEIPDNFDYYALGHIHKYVNDAYGRGRLVYPGSGEIWKTSELADYRKNGKGFVVVDFDGSKPVVKRVKVDIPREFIERNIDYDDLESGIAAIKETIKDFDKKPILRITIRDVDSDTSKVYEIIKEQLGDLALMIRPTFIMAGEEYEPLDNDKGNGLGPEQLLEERLKGYGNQKVTDLAIDLYHLLSKDKLDESEGLINQYYDDHYKDYDEEIEFITEEVKKEDPPEEKNDDVQVTFGEVLK
jgi:DNA repair exonuclease SbcCD nuclease subunit